MLRHEAASARQPRPKRRILRFRPRLEPLLFYRTLAEMHDRKARGSHEAQAVVEKAAEARWWWQGGGEEGARELDPLSGLSLSDAQHSRMAHLLQDMTGGLHSLPPASAPPDLTFDASLQLLKLSIKAAATTASADVPVAVDYRADANPYRARYGDADWRAKVTAATSMNKYKCVTDMVEHIVLETRKAGCTHFYHDALALMTATSTVDWMRGKGYLEMWIRPEHGILDEFPQFKGASPGNRPEWMPMDKYLNKNLHDGVVQHVGHTKRYAKEDPRKFRADTPRRLESAYLRVWEGCPSLERIRSDVSRFITALTEVKLAKGIILTEAGYGRNGAGRGGDSSNHGGSRVKTAVADEKWVHSDAKAGQARTRTVGK